MKIRGVIIRPLFFVLTILSVASCDVISMLEQGGAAPRTQSSRSKSKPAVLSGSNYIDVSTLGVKGDGVTDDSKALEKAISACLAQGKICYVPRTSRHYLLNNSVRIPLKSGQSLQIVSDGATLKTGSGIKEPASRIWKLTPSFKEVALLSIGPAADNKAFPNNFGNNKGIKVTINGLNFDAGAQPQQAITPNGALIISGLDLSAEEITVTNCDFFNITGYGIRSFGVKKGTIENNVFRSVGGRGVFPDSDAFGDAIYTAAVSSGGVIAIKDNQLVGSVRRGRKSRSGITFEFSRAKYTANIENCYITGYAKSIHIEEPAPAVINVRNSQLLNANYSIAMVLNTKGVCNVYDSEITVGGTDQVESGDGGPVINTDGGGTLNFYRSKLQLNGPRNAYVSMVGVKEVKDSEIYAYNKNPYFADANVTFTGCTFHDFGGADKSFFSYAGNNRFRVVNSTFRGGGNVHANGQRVKVDFENTRAVSGQVKLIGR